MTKTQSSIIGAGAFALALLATPLITSAAEEAQKPKSYPLKTCLVSGEELGSMEDPVVVNHQGQEIKFCCKDCVKSFNKEPDKYLKKLDEGAKKTDDHSSHAHH
jgi:YHS domain-containing protein